MTLKKDVSEKKNRTFLIFFFFFLLILMKKFLSLILMGPKVLFFAPFLNRPSEVPLILHDLDCFDQRKTRLKGKKIPFLSCWLRSTQVRSGGVVTSQKNDFTRSALRTFRSSASVRNIFHEFIRGRVNTTSKPNFSLPLQTSAELNAVK